MYFLPWGSWKFHSSLLVLFWKHLIASLKNCNCLSDDYLLNNLVVLGLKPDTFKNKVIINFNFATGEILHLALQKQRKYSNYWKFEAFFFQTIQERNWTFFSLVTFTSLGSLCHLHFPSYQTFPTSLFSALICKYIRLIFQWFGRENMFNWFFVSSLSWKPVLQKFALHPRPPLYSTDM